MKTFSAAIVLLLSFAASPADAQTFSSGSTGADGALDLATLNCTTGPYAPLNGQNAGCWIQLPESGILNYTTVNVPINKALYFRRNRRNTPVVLLTQGEVVVMGAIYIDATRWAPDNRLDETAPGPGGFPGGAPPAGIGFGPGGGTAGGPVGRWVGPLSLVPIVGGSGGAAAVGYTGTGGGGAIAIASSGEIKLTGQITARGGYYVGGQHCGSGGAVRLVANRLSVTGVISAAGCGPTNSGIVRLEAPTGALSYTGSSTPEPILSTINPSILAPASPELRIVSVGGFLVPESAGSRKDAADLVLPKQLPDPINVVVEATNIPVGSPVTISVVTGNQGTAPSVALSGSLANSTATIGVSGLNRDQLAYLYVQVLFAPPAAGAAAASAVSESARVSQVRMTIGPGAKPQFAFLRRDGTEVPVDKLPANLRAWVSNPYLR